MITRRAVLALIGIVPASALAARKKSRSIRYGYRPGATKERDGHLTIIQAPPSRMWSAA